jgi:acyl-CoA thioesterase FadM
MQSECFSLLQVCLCCLLQKSYAISVNDGRAAYSFCCADLTMKFIKEITYPDNIEVSQVSFLTTNSIIFSYQIYPYFHIGSHRM